MKLTETAGTLPPFDSRTVTVVSSKSFMAAHDLDDRAFQCNIVLAGDFQRIDRREDKLVSPALAGVGVAGAVIAQAPRMSACIRANIF